MAVRPSPRPSPTGPGTPRGWPSHCLRLSPTPRHQCSTRNHSRRSTTKHRLSWHPPARAVRDRAMTPDHLRDPNSRSLFLSKVKDAREPRAADLLVQIVSRWQGLTIESQMSTWRRWTPRRKSIAAVPKATAALPTKPPPNWEVTQTSRSSRLAQHQSPTAVLAFPVLQSHTEANASLAREPSIDVRGGRSTDQFCSARSTTTFHSNCALSCPDDYH